MPPQLTWVWLILSVSTGAASGFQVDAGDSSDAETVSRLDEEAAALEAEFRHDFSKGFPHPLFAVQGDDRAVSEQADGLYAKAEEAGGVSGIRLCMQLHGDFDVTASFKDLKITIPGAKGRAGIGLITCLENTTQDNIAVYRRDDRVAQETRLAFVHRVLQSNGKLKFFEKNVVEDSTAGRLRLSRRGKQIYGLYAPGQDEPFRILQMRTVAEGDVSVQGLRLLQQSNTNLKTEVVWQDIHVCAARISGRPVGDPTPTIAALNTRRTGLKKLQIDMSDAESVDNHLKLDSQTSQVREHDGDGLRVSLLSDGQKTSKLTGTISLPASFDIEADLKVHQLETPDGLTERSEIGLQIFVSSDAPAEAAQPIEASFLLRPNPGGTRTLVVRYVGHNRAQQKIYRPIRNVSVVSPDRFRLALRDQKLLFLYSEEGDDDDILVAEYPVKGNVSAKSLALFSNARGKAYITDVTWKSVHIYGRAGEQ